MTNLKQKIKTLIEAEKHRLGSYAAVAVKCKVSEATISLIMEDKYPAKDEAMLDKIAYALDYEDEDDGWVYVPTAITNSTVKLAQSAKQKSLFVPISDRAGIGKSSALRYYMRTAQENTYYIRCREWGLGTFLKQLCRTLGISLPSGYLSNDDLAVLVFEYFAKRRRKKAQLIIDEANKLKPSAKRFFIPLFNETEGTLSVVIAGTEDLKKEVERGVQYAQKGYDEIDSRFGRKFIQLFGITLKEAQAICTANGVTGASAQEKAIKECGTVQVSFEDADTGKITFSNRIQDVRRLKRIIIRHQLLNQ